MGKIAFACVSTWATAWGDFAHADASGAVAHPTSLDLSDRKNLQPRRALELALRELRRQLRHFVKVTQSYRPGLFHCYRSAELPRTNNDLEHLFGSHRYHERRASGRKAAAPGLVVMAPGVNSASWL